MLKFGSLMQQSIDMAAEDLARAIAYLCDHESELDINPYRIVLAGCSAGAIVALQLGYYVSNSMLNQVTMGLPKINRVPLRPAAIAAYSGAVLCDNRGIYHEDPIPTMLYHGLRDKIVRPGMTPCSFGRRLYGSMRLYDEFKRHEKGTFRNMIFPEAYHEVSLLLPKSVEQFCTFVDDAFAGKDGHSSGVSLRRTGLESAEWQRNIFEVLRSSQQEEGSSL